VADVAGRDDEADDRAEAAGGVLAAEDGGEGFRRSMPFSSGTTIVSSPSIGLALSAAAGSCHALTASRIASTGPTVRGSSVACGRSTVKSPLTLSTRRPLVRRASSVAPRAMKVVSMPACARRPPK
jgi:hypothetical protein